jgi:hypothetical protein
VCYKIQKRQNFSQNFRLALTVFDSRLNPNPSRTRAVGADVVIPDGGGRHRAIYRSSFSAEQEPVLPAPVAQRLTDGDGDRHLRRRHHDHASEGEMGHVERPMILGRGGRHRVIRRSSFSTLGGAGARAPGSVARRLADVDGDRKPRWRHHDHACEGEMGSR